MGNEHPTACAVPQCRCKRYEPRSWAPSCEKCNHGEFLHNTKPPSEDDLPRDPPLPVDWGSWNYKRRLKAGYYQVNLFGQNLSDEKDMRTLGALLAAPKQVVRTLWLNSTRLHGQSLEIMASWLPNAKSLRELYLVTNPQVGSRGTQELFGVLERNACQLKMLACDYSMSTKSGDGGPLVAADLAAIFRAIGHTRHLRFLSLNLPQPLTLEQEVAVSESIKYNRSLHELHLYTPPSESVVPMRLNEPYFSIVHLRLALNRSRGQYTPQIFAFMLGFASTLAKQPNKSSCRALAIDPLFDRNVIYLMLQFAFG